MQSCRFSVLVFDNIFFVWYMYMILIFFLYSLLVTNATMSCFNNIKFMYVIIGLSNICILIVLICELINL